MKVVYDIFIQLYPKLVALAAIFNPKAKKWITGRKETWSRLNDFKTTQKNEPIVWIHCASLGEFEQGRPIIETIKHQHPNYNIAISFFSPSGYEVRKDYEFADIVFYLPMDSPANARKLIELLNPSLTIFVKYEYWFYYFRQIHAKKIPLIIASAVYRKQQIFFKWYGSLYRNMLRYGSHFFVQDETSSYLLQQLIAKDKISVSGDTRFDRVASLAKNHFPIPPIEAFCKNKKIIVAGSTWPTDDIILSDLANSNNDIFFIIAPHDIHAKRLHQCLSTYKKAMRYSEYLNNSTINQSVNCLIIDNVGLLSKLYYYATIAFIGGGFAGDGVHNVLEAATYGKPVLHGPIYDKYLEAIDLIEAGGAFVVTNQQQLKEIASVLLNNENDYTQASKSARKYIESKTGATQAIMQYIQENRLLTN